MALLLPRRNNKNAGHGLPATPKSSYCLALPVVSKTIAEAKKGGGTGAGLKAMMLQAKKEEGGSIGARIQEVSASSQEGVFKPPDAVSVAPPWEGGDPLEDGITAALRAESDQLRRVYSSFVGDEDAGELGPKTLVELAAEPEFNEEICRLAKWQRQGISAADMAGRRKVCVCPYARACMCHLRWCR